MKKDVDVKLFALSLLLSSYFIYNQLFIKNFLFSKKFLQNGAFRRYGSQQHLIYLKLRQKHKNKVTPIPSKKTILQLTPHIEVNQTNGKSFTNTCPSSILFSEIPSTIMKIIIQRIPYRCCLLIQNRFMLITIFEIALQVISRTESAQV